MAKTANKTETSPANESATSSAIGAKPPIYLLDSMAFIFRAYHAMQRQRPMSTRTGIPTAATYVFVNMINKLRKDFAPQYLAAVYDVGAPVHRNELATQLKDVQKFNIKTQQFETVEYGGYKANRTETPPDLIQQQPYIRRALEAFRIPILYYEGFEADDVIGTLSHKLAALGHHVYVVSSDKDMMQLVNRDVSILNPTKDNLILDPPGVEAVLGVPPERVVDVMALRGDSVDNIPGAPGIGDKGSVELIQQFGTVEAALDAATSHPEQVKRKTYRESLQNNRENILLSKELVTIHTSVPIEYSLEAMRTQPVDNAACRALFAELEFTTLLKELAPAVDNTVIEYNLKPSDSEISQLLKEAREEGRGKREGPKGLAIAIFEDARAIAEETAAEPSDEGGEPEPPPAENMTLFGTAPAALIPEPAVQSLPEDLANRLGLAVSEGSAIEVSLDAPGVREALADAALPKDVHDLKAILRALAPHGVALKGVRDDVMLLSYLVNPTHGSHTLPDIAARTTSRALVHQVTKDNPVDPKRLPEAAAAIVRLAAAIGEQIAESGPVEHHIPVDDPSLGGAMTTEMLFAAPATATAAGGSSALHEVYETIDKPLVPVLLRMEQAGVRIDPEFLRGMSTRLAVEIDNLAERIYTDSGNRFNINSPKQLGDVLFNKMLLPKPMKYGKGKVVSTAQDVLEELAENHPIAALVIEHRQLQKLKSTYLDQLPALADSEGRIHTTFNQVGTATGRLSSTNPNLQNIPVRTAVGREIRAAFIAAQGNVLMSADYSQIELRLMAHFSQDPLLLDAYRTGKDIHTLTASEVFEVDAATMDKETRNRAKAVNFGIVYGISPFGLAAQLGIDQRTAREYIERYFDRYKGVQRFIEETLETVRKEQAVRTYFGRVRPIPDIQSRNPNMRGFAERTAVNTPLQGTAADLIKLAMLRIDQVIRERKMRSRMTLQVHDELLFDVVPEESGELERIVRHEMEHVAEFSVPIVAEVGVGKNWRDIK
ncbi:DNA polymerase I [Edaphobacter aggregans]|uniref:DNA polymerase I n=1 Tax=Edaphobacter aggregans TaxID=570835 RepID=A0A428MHD0_9BACT|nr:DNA polymerase I [Edaphobacter aggregans]RSL16306.1 DNA polymerase I [Edaphobacter aggregans]